VFVDADVRPGAHLLDGLAAALTGAPGAVVSVQPWHDAGRPGERITGLANVVALMGSGAFTVAGRRAGALVAFGPVLAVARADYDRAGGHAGDAVRASLTEDIELARAVGASRLYSDRRDATFRMYPRGLGQALAGWSRTLAAGIAATPWWLLVGVAGWVASLAGGPFTGWLAYPLSAVQVWVLGRRAGRIGPVLAAAYPVLVLGLLAVVAGATWRRLRGRTTWKGRSVRAA
jgi:4,4'-diaponeurosporenoate glycosyltransferase